MTSRFTELETESYYDAEDAIYRSVWDEGGSVHWGFFDESTGTDFLTACEKLNKIMVEKGDINQESNALDLGCGNGTTAIWLTGETGAKVTSIDLSGVRVANAQGKLTNLHPDVRKHRLLTCRSLMACSAMSGVRRSYTTCPTSAQCWGKIYRVLSSGGTVVFDDLLRPKRNITPDAQTYVYDRLLFDTEFTFDSYQQALKDQGFKVVEALDLSPHLKQSYLCLADRTPKDDTSEAAEHYRWLTKAYIETAAAVDRDELGWGLFVCRK